MSNFLPASSAQNVVHVYRSARGHNVLMSVIWISIVENTVFPKESNMRRPMKYSCVRIGPVHTSARCPRPPIAPIERYINSRDFAQSLCRNTTSTTFANVRDIYIRRVRFSTITRRFRKSSMVLTTRNGHDGVGTQSSHP